jgi:uncharacterized protein (TIGR03083 family)
VELLATYVRAWRESAADVGELGAQLTDSDWESPTDCPGWRARDVLAHLVDIEEWLAAESPPDEARGASMSEWTQYGVDQRRDVPPATLLAALATAVDHRAAELETVPPADLQDQHPRTPAALPWSWETLLRNRAIDMWVHSQDIRRAVGRAGGYDNAGAMVTTASFGLGLPYVVGKKVQPPAGTVVVWDVDGTHPAQHTVVMSDSGRAVTTPQPPVDPAVRLGMDTETFVVLAAGRRRPGDVAVRVEGDRELADRVLHAMVLTF